MDFYHEETDWFHVYANPPGLHGRLMATVESERAAKQYLLELDGVPLEAWEPRQYSKDGDRVDIWICRYASAGVRAYEAAGTYISAERVRVVRIGVDRQAV